MQISKNQTDHASEIVKKAVVIDTMMQGRLERSFFDRCEKGGLTAFINALSFWPENFRSTLLKWLFEYRFVMQNVDKCFLVETTEEIRKAKKDGRIGVILGLQQADCIENDLSLLTVWRKLGLKSLQLTYNSSNYIGAGCEEKNDGGLTNFGFDVIEEMNTLGIMVDLSHVGSKTSLDAISASKVPVAFTHATPRAKSEHPKSHTDEEIKALAEIGGVMGIACEAPYLLWNLWKKEGKVRPVTVSDYMEHLEHVINLVGIDYVGIGTDITEFITLEGWKRFKERSSYGWYPYPEDPAYPLYPKGMGDASEPYLTVTSELVARGYSDEEIRKVLGENWLRVFGKVWRPGSFNESKIQLDFSKVSYYHYPPYYPKK